MAEFSDVVRNRRMTRAFDPTPIDPSTLADLVELASRAPSAGKTQGWHLLVLEGDAATRYWDLALPRERRATFRWTHLLDAPVIALAFADPQAYVDRYGEPDKQASGLGAGADAWPTPYWTVDASMAVMTLLLAAEDRGLGALFFGVFRGEAEIRAEFAVPDGLQLIGAIALGRPRAEPPRPERDEAGASEGRTDGADGSGRSAGRRRRSPDEIIHRNRW